MIKTTSLLHVFVVLGLSLTITCNDCYSNPINLKVLNQYMLSSLDGFSPVKKKLDGGYIEIEELTLKFVYTEKYSVETGKKLDYKIYDFQGTEVNNLPNLDISFGENRLSIVFTEGQISNDSFYTLEITDQKGEKWYLKFKR